MGEDGVPLNSYVLIRNCEEKTYERDYGID